jgi:hypothetical protein
MSKYVNGLPMLSVTQFMYFVEIWHRRLLLNSGKFDFSGIFIQMESINRLFLVTQRASARETW